MNMISTLKSLSTRAALLVEEAQAIQAEAAQLRALILGDTSPEDVDEGTDVPADDNLPVKASRPATKMPSLEDIRAKAVEFGVDIEDLLPTDIKTRPKLQAKNEAMRRIYAAKSRLEAQRAAAAVLDLGAVED